MSVPLSRRRANARAGAAAAEAAIDTEKARRAEWQKASTAARREAAAEREASRRRYTAADLDGVTHVHDGVSWRRVAKVNAKSVTVATAYSWTDRLTFAQVYDARTVAAS